MKGIPEERIIRDMKTKEEFILVEWGDLRFWYRATEEGSKIYERFAGKPTEEVIRTKS